MDLEKIETVEEVAIRESNQQQEGLHDYYAFSKTALKEFFIRGAKWQSEQTKKEWTDEDLLNAFKAGEELGCEEMSGEYGISFTEWIEKYKMTK